MSEKFALERAADEAAFEDWDAWRALDDRRYCRSGVEADHREMLADRKSGRADRWSRYYCIHSAVRTRFEIHIPFREPMLSLVRRIPGATVDRRASRHGDPMFSGVYIIPATSWRELRAALPAIKRGVLDHVARVDGVNNIWPDRAAKEARTSR